jgi:hypothetical protein
MRPAFSAARDIGLSLFCTTRFENAPRGPFFARFFIGIIPGLVARICIHGAVDKDGFVVFRCTLEESQATVTTRGEVAASKWKTAGCAEVGRRHVQRWSRLILVAVSQ